MGNNSVILLKKVSYRKNVILVEFNKNMNINFNQIDIEHSYLNYMNYAIENAGVLLPFPKGTKSTDVEFALSVRFSLPKSFLGNVYDDGILHLGHVHKRKIFYIQSADGDIPNICSISSLGKEIEELSLENGEIQIIDKKTLKYSYKGENRFEYVSISDFYILKNNNMYHPSKIEKLNSKEFLLKFQKPILNEDDGSIVLKVARTPESKDIYGFSIKGDLEIFLSKILSTFNFLNYENGLVYFKLRFLKPIKIFDPTDFIIYYDNNSFKVIDYLGSSQDRTVIDIRVNNINVNNIQDAIFEISTDPNILDVNTTDDDEKKVFLKDKFKSSLFKCFKVNWLLRDYNFSNSILSVEFNKNILPKSLISDYSVFEGNVTSWNGERVTIKEGNLKIQHDSNNIITLSLTGNDSFGKINIQNKLNFKFITENLISNTKPCYIYVQENKLFLEFHKDEELDGILVFIKEIAYYPSSIIESLDKNFIFYGYSPIGTYTLDNIIYVEPLKDISENPFTGVNLTGNYILGIHDNEKIRSYGDILNETQITGFLRLVGRMEVGEEVFINNLKVSGTIIIDASKVNPTLTNVSNNDNNLKIKTR